MLVVTGSKVQHISSTGVGGDRFKGSAYHQYRLVYLTGPQVRQYSTYQGGRTGQGEEVVASFR